MGADEQTLQELLKEDRPIKFDWSNRWLKGEEYAHIIKHMELYCETFSLPKFSPKTHPESIYIQPESKFILPKNTYLDGMIYFVKGNTIGSDFGFPRLAFKKRFKW